MNIILFGGAFDPPHLGHQHIAKTLLEQKIADEAWFVPAKMHPFDKPMSPPHHRLAMLELIVSDPRIKIERYEQEREGVSFSHETLDYLAAKHPEHTFSWIVGSDRLGDFHTWVDGRGNDYKDMLAAYRFYVYPRAGFPFTPLYDNMVPLRDVQEWTYSSTEVREAVKKGEGIESLVDPQVAAYIAKHQLYLS